MLNLAFGAFHPPSSHKPDAQGWHPTSQPSKLHAGAGSPNKSVLQESMSCYRSCLFFFSFLLPLFLPWHLTLSPKRRLSKLGGAGSFSLFLLLLPRLRLWYHLFIYLFLKGSMPICSRQSLKGHILTLIELYKKGAFCPERNQLFLTLEGLKQDFWQELAL